MSIVLNCTLPPCCRPGAEGSPKNSGGPNIIMQHPMHLHGHHFWVLGHGLGVFNESNASQVGSLNTANPVFRDTAMLPKGGWVVLRFLANNPGAWPLHCHILWHHYMGQQVRWMGQAVITEGHGIILPFHSRRIRVMYFNHVQ